MSELISLINPGLVLILGALILPFLPHVARGALMLALPVAGLAVLLGYDMGTTATVNALGLELTPLRVDALSYVFGLVFLLAAFAAALFSLHVKGWLEATAALMYAGSAIGAVFAGDYVTLFVYWEITAITSVFLIWARGTPAAFDAGLRYLLWQVASGVILLAGVLMHYQQTGSIAFGPLAQLTFSNLENQPLSTQLILLAFAIKAAFPLLHPWLQDAYPSATHTGTVWLSAFTTKLAIYVLARAFAGSELLIPIGAVMAVFPLFYAVIADDLRKVLAYSLNIQLGYMVVAVGIGTELALNGAAAHAFTHIVYKSLLFMAMGAVLFRAGTVQASALGGLHRQMPITAGLCLIGVLSIAAFPPFSGYVSKSPITSAVTDGGHEFVWMALTVAGVGAILYAGVKVFYGPFFGAVPDTSEKDTSDKGAAEMGATPLQDVREAPLNMLLAMGLCAVGCVVLGVAPDLLYSVLPFPMDYSPYSASKVVMQLQILLLAVLGAVFLLTSGLFPRNRAGTYLDADWLYRKFAYNVASTALMLLAILWRTVSGGVQAVVGGLERSISRAHNPDGIMGRTWSTGTMAFWAIAMLAVYLVLLYMRDLPIAQAALPN
ncbi:MAG: Na(+)/H(+) antiporter subunit D [Pseudomonadota bacterium]